MLSKEIILQIRSLSSEGYSCTQIGKLLNISYPSVKKYISGDALLDLNAESPLSSGTPKNLRPYVRFVDDYLKSGITSRKKIEFLLRQKGYRGSYQALNKFIRQQNDRELIKKTDAYYRIETDPGEQAQVDWGHFGTIKINGQKRNLYVFSLILSYSRACYAEFVINQKQKTLQNCHANAFRYLGGIPKKIRYDNMKTVVIRRDNKDGTQVVHWNLDFKNFAHYFKFDIEICPPYYPRSKGKVEASIKFLRHNFYHGEIQKKTYKDLDELNVKLRDWLDSYANVRKHPTKQASTVDELWDNEKSLLQDMASFGDFQTTSSEVRRISRISMLTYKGAFYLVPKEYVQCKVEVREVIMNGETYIQVFWKDTQIAEYPLAISGSWILSNENVPVKAKDRDREISKRVLSHPIYNLKVQTRSLDYYQNLMENYYG